MSDSGAIDLPQLALSVVVPCFNEELRITATLREMLTELPRLVGQSFEIIVVDDGSSDGTIPTVNALIGEGNTCIRVVPLASNRGKGAAVRAGVAESRGKLIVMADADGSTPMSELSKLSAAISSGADIAIGSRALTADGVVLKTRIHRKLLGRLFNGVVNLLVLPGIQDTQCGFKLFTSRVGQELFPLLHVDHFGFDIEFLMMARRHDFKVSEVAVSWHHVSGSKVNLLTDSARMLATVIRLYFGR